MLYTSLTKREMLKRISEGQWSPPMEVLIPAGKREDDGVELALQWHLETCQWPDVTRVERN
jgi:hypothetical protein